METSWCSILLEFCSTKLFRLKIQEFIFFVYFNLTYGISANSSNFTVSHLLEFHLIYDSLANYFFIFLLIFFVYFLLLSQDFSQGEALAAPGALKTVELMMDAHNTVANMNKVTFDGLSFIF